MRDLTPRFVRFVCDPALPLFSPVPNSPPDDPAVPAPLVFLPYLAPAGLLLGSGLATRNPVLLARSPEAIPYR